MAECLSLPACLEVRSSPGCGRGLYAKEAISRGSQLLSQQPLACVAKGDVRQYVCQNCLFTTEDAVKLLNCGKCKIIHYCSKACQAKDWRFHKKECGGLSQVRREILDAVLLVTRLMIVTGKSESKKQQLEYLDSNLNEQAKTNMVDVVRAVAFLLGVDLTEDTRSTIAGVYARAARNTFVVLDHDWHDSVGLAVYGEVSLVNHSCVPNCGVRFNGKELFLTAMGGPLKPGDQIFISYCESMNTRASRHAQLMKGYNLRCSCLRCETEESEGSRWSLMYASNRERDVSEISKVRAMEEGFSLLKTLKELERAHDWAGIVEKCSVFMTEFGGDLHPLNVALTCIRAPLMMAQLGLTQLQAALETGEFLTQLQAALETGEFLTQAYRQFLQDWDPLRVLHLSIIGELRRLTPTDDNLRASIDELEEAQRVIPITFGRGHPLESKVTDMLVDSRKQLASNLQI